MTLTASIQITLYDAEDEPIQTYSRTRVPTEILLQAMELSEELDGFDQEKADSQSVRAMFENLGAFVVEVFGGRFELGDLLKGAEIDDLITVVKAVSNRASHAVSQNPTPRPLRTKRPKRN